MVCYENHIDKISEKNWTGSENSWKEDKAETGKRIIRLKKRPMKKTQWFEIMLTFIQEIML